MHRVTIVTTAAVLLSVASVASAQSGGGAAKAQARGVHVLPQTDFTPEPAPAPAPVVPAPVAAPVVAPIPVVHRCARPFADPGVTLGSAAGDARSLAGPLKRGRAVTVDLVQPYPIQGEPPASLAPWLDEVRAAGGSVDLSRYCDQTAGRGFFQWLFGRRKPEEPGTAYKAAARYNAVLHADVLAGKITQVEFVPKAAADH